MKSDSEGKSDSDHSNKKQSVVNGKKFLEKSDTRRSNDGDANIVDRRGARGGHARWELLFGYNKEEINESSDFDGKRDSGKSEKNQLVVV